ncbi:hypothetical protein ABIA43_007623 [Bradyrhizobium sp. USDA 328]
MRITSPRLPTGWRASAPVMADPEHAGDDEAERKAYQLARIDPGKVVPVRRAGEHRRLGQIVGQQRHGDTENGVAERFQPSHLELVGLELGHLGHGVRWNWGPSSP